MLDRLLMFICTFSIAINNQVHSFTTFYSSFVALSAFSDFFDFSDFSWFFVTSNNTWTRFSEMTVLAITLPAKTLSLRLPTYTSPIVSFLSFHSPITTWTPNNGSPDHSSSSTTSSTPHLLHVERHLNSSGCSGAVTTSATTTPAGCKELRL